MRRKIVVVSLLLAMALGCNGEGVNSGDRVLVAKFLYEAKVTEPNRFDVVVFKYPGKREHGRITGGPIENNIPKNYIKRLLGLPGELLAIFFGRLFKASPNPSPADFPPDDKDGPVKAEDVWEKKHMRENDTNALSLFDERSFQIIRKPPAVMLALRRIVYDNDFQAADLKGVLPPRWQMQRGSGWAAADKSFAHNGEAGPGWLRYQHILRPLPGTPVVGGENRPPELITDHLGYNSSLPIKNSKDASRGRNWVGDLMLECQLDVKKSDGEFWMELSKGIHRFQARFQLQTGDCTLWRKRLGGELEQVAEAKATRLKGPGSYQVRFANIDARLTVWIDNDLPFKDGYEYDPPEVRKRGADGTTERISQEDLVKRRGPTDNDFEPASLAALGAHLQVQHLRLWRDTFYTTQSSAGDVSIDAGSWADPKTLDLIRGSGPLTLYVQPGHYLVLGDNSPESADSRDWGVVPERLMLGRALLVYFPFNRAGLIR